jgi:phenylalanine-4-hydroxylase
MDGPSPLPAHLRKFVVSQNYAAYTAEDQAVWRFVLLQTHSRHLRTAHPAYAAGFEAAGISVSEIPRVTRMNERLRQHGFQAICVDGFIPPRAFQAFQARGFLPIAADIRTSRHLTYTPAPDIIHEAAGHAPFLAHADYARFLRRIGALGEQAFTNAHDQAVYEAIFVLSELKEDPHATAVQISAAEAQLELLTRQAAEPSEAARLSRLYWWTVEYGLIGRPDDYRIYGAGLLSSIGEGHFCHEPGVAKLPLTAACLDVAYDITRPQPQLFVARDFAHLNEVLEEAGRGLACHSGGERALGAALASAEPACLELEGGLALTGVVERVLRDGEQAAAVVLHGDCALSRGDQVLSGVPRPRHYVLPLGRLADGRSLGALGPEALRALCDARGQLRLETSVGLCVQGRVQTPLTAAAHLEAIVLADCEVTWRGQPLLRTTEPYPLALTGHVVTAHARPPQGYYPDTQLAATQVPKPRQLDAAQRELVTLYEQALSALSRAFGSDVVPELERVHRALCERHPEEWLLRWNLLESLVKLGAGGATTAQLARELSQLELRYAHREPIATGLRYLRSLGLATDDEKAAGGKHERDM